ncbi:MAG TPA: ABC transporter permease [Chloroflexia bacterium]|nr:ABC transporter permease [Chloroflexia bacterium]
MASTTPRAITAPAQPRYVPDELPAVAKRRLPAWARSLLRNPLSVAGLIILLIFAIIALLAPVIAPPPAGSVDPYIIPRDGFLAEPQPPSAAHPFGTSQGQYDIFYGVIWGTRTAFKVGIIITALTVIIGGLIGAVSGFIGGWVDEVIQRFVEIVMAFPFLLAAITLATVLAPKIQDRLLSAGIALVAFSWPTYARLIRGDVLAIKDREYVMAARVLGASGWRILMRHVVPNSMFTLLVVASLDIGAYVLSFAALSFLQLGPPQGYADWGQLISFARNWIPSLSDYWYIVVFPGAALLLFVLGWNLLGDAFRDALDPKMRGNG